jgi:hypothetical protein
LGVLKGGEAPFERRFWVGRRLFELVWEKQPGVVGGKKTWGGVVRQGDFFKMTIGINNGGGFDIVAFYPYNELVIVLIRGV